MHLDIHPIDPSDDAAYDAWWDAYAQAKRADMGEYALVWTHDECRAELLQPSETTRRLAVVAERDGEVVGSGSLALFLKDNLHAAAVGVTVPPQYRREGVGTALLQHLEAAAVADGRTSLRAETAWLASAPVDGAGEPGREFARRHGYEIALGDLQNRLRLPVAGDLIDGLRATAPADGYTLHGWVGPVPEHFVAEWAALDAIIDTEAPTGDLDLEAGSGDVADLRADEALHETQNRMSFGVVATAADDSIAAYSQLVVSGDDGNAYQWGTLVRREHRGHRLGLRLKLENLALLQQHRPDVPQIYTYNAESNAHMLAVNTLLGFEATGRLAELQKRV